MNKIQALALAASFAGLALAGGGLDNPDQGKDRGQATIQQSTMPREERESPAAKIPKPYSGFLIDAGCKDRTLHNLRLQPESLTSSIATTAGAAADQASNEGSASGITVSPQTLQGERADIMPHQVPDMRTRQPEPTCAITASTATFSLLLPDGRLLDLDPGGNTYAWQGVYATSDGRAMLNGFAPPFKPLAKLKGYIQGSTLVVESPVDVENSTPAPSSAAAPVKAPVTH